MKSKEGINVRLEHLLPDEGLPQKKPAQPRHEKAAPDRQRPVVKKQFVIDDIGSVVTLDARGFRDKTGQWKDENVATAAKAYPGKEIRFKDKTSGHLYLDRTKFFKPDGSNYTNEGWEKYKNLKGSKDGSLLSYYDPPNDKILDKKVSAPPKTNRLDTVPANKVTKIARAPLPAEKRSKGITEHDLIKKEKELLRRKTAAAEIDALQRLHSSSLGKNISKDLTKDFKVRKVRPKKVVAPRPTISTTKARKQAAKDSAAHLREVRKQYLEAERQRKNLQYEANQIKDKVRRRQKKVMQRARRSDARASEFRRKLGTAPGFGRTPLKMLMAQQGISARAPGARKALASMTHAEKYPARNLASQGAFASSAKGRQTLSVPEALRDSSGGRMAQMRGSRKGTIFATANTLSAGKAPGGSVAPGGIFFRIDATNVIENLTRNYPAAIRQAAISVADRIGRKMLDIVEPYVPKDTGLLYMSGQTNVEQTAGGAVDMEGGDAYPAAQMFGVSISYNAPYAELVYFDKSKRHGKDYNDEYGTAEKDERETARWIEVAFQQERGALSGLLQDYSAAITASMSAAGRVTFMSRSGKWKSFVPAVYR